MEKTFFSDQDFNMWWLIMYAWRAMDKARSRELSKYGLTPEQAGTLFMIQAIGSDATSIQIAKWILNEPHSVSYLLGRMEKAGLVKRTKDIKRKNSIKVNLTQKGHEAYEQASNRNSIHEIMSCLSKEEQEQLRVSLQKLLDKAKQVGNHSEILFPFAPSP
jgi:DNA-binding MarR family transcriptional regulator